MAEGKKIERKYLVHYIDASFGEGTANYVRLGEDLEEYNEELNPSVETKRNIWGENRVDHNGYEPQSDVDPYYAYDGDALWDKVAAIANGRLTGDDCKTTKVDALIKTDGTCVWAYCEDVYVVPTTLGGDTSGVQAAFSVYAAGNRKAGTFNATTKKFTAASA